MKQYIVVSVVTARSNHTAGNRFFYVIGIIIFVLDIIYGLILDIGTLNAFYGLTGVIFGIVVSPIIVVAIPIYFLINGYWFPAIIIYGGGIISTLLINKNRTNTDSQTV
jgi:hypothetical protein